MNGINNQDVDYLKSATVLYVEDEGCTRELFSLFLTQSVGTLITAVDGVEGLEAFKNHLPDIVITDVIMPVMDGIAMSAAIRKISPFVPIIVLTAFEQTDLLKKAIAANVTKYVTKPVKNQELLDCLIDCVHILRAEQQLRQQHQREVQEIWAKQNKDLAIITSGIAEDYSDLMQKVLSAATSAKMQLTQEDNKASGYFDEIIQYTNNAYLLGNLLNILGNDYKAKTVSAHIMPYISDVVKNALTGTDIVFKMEYADDLPQVYYIEEQLQLVFKSLTINAVDAMASNGMLTLSAKCVEILEQDPVPIIPGPYLLISLTDNGEGISPEVLPNIFTPYFSTKPHSTQRGGLSLSLCRIIIVKHGGIITAGSTLGKGTIIRIWLPIGSYAIMD